jgi:Cft2 family RNA processing exonuclease
LLIWGNLGLNINNNNTMRRLQSGYNLQGASGRKNDDGGEYVWSTLSMYENSRSQLYIMKVAQWNLLPIVKKEKMCKKEE